ncbi:MAG TPA: hypothetical protein VGG16_10995, partial [Streptosporangiaceae bacterium]
MVIRPVSPDLVPGAFTSFPERTRAAPNAGLVAWSRLGSAYSTAELSAAREKRELIELDAILRPARTSRCTGLPVKCLMGCCVATGGSPTRRPVISAVLLCNALKKVAVSMVFFRVGRFFRVDGGSGTERTRSRD